MSTNLYKRPDGILYQKTGELTITIPFGILSSINIKVQHNKQVLQLVLSSERPPYLDEKYDITYSEVVLPTSTDATDLKTQLTSWNLGYTQPEEFIAKPAQTAFVTSQTMTNPSVYINGVLQPTSDYSYVASSKTLTFVVRCVGGEQISIVNNL